MIRNSYQLYNYKDDDDRNVYVAGQSPRRLMTGFMLTTMFLSMWISNTAATAMVVPIVDAVLQLLYKVNRPTLM